MNNNTVWNDQVWLAYEKTDNPAYTYQVKLGTETIYNSSRIHNASDFMLNYIKTIVEMEEMLAKAMDYNPTGDQEDAA